MAIDGINPISTDEYRSQYYSNGFVPAGATMFNTSQTPVVIAQPPASTQTSTATSTPTVPSPSLLRVPGSGFIDGVGANLGFSSGVPVYGGMGPAQLPWMQPGMVANPTVAASGVVPTTTAPGSLSSSTLSGVLGAAGMGYFGGSILAGMIGGNPTTGGLGGAGGAAIGTAIGGPIGGIVGGLAGSLGGSLFGNKKPNPASMVGSDFGITPDGGFVDGGKLSSKHADTSFASTMRNNLSAVNRSIHEQTGLDLSGVISSLQSGYDVNHGPGIIALNTSYKQTADADRDDSLVFTFDPKDGVSMIGAVRQYANKVLDLSGQDYTQEQRNAIVNRAVSSIAQSSKGTGSVPTTDVAIQQRIGDKQTFDEFLTDYRSKYRSM